MSLFAEVFRVMVKLQMCLRRSGLVALAWGMPTNNETYG